MKNFKFEISNLRFPRAGRPLLITALCLLPSAYCLLPPAARAAAWERQRTGTFAWLHSVFFVDVRRGWAVGGKGALLATADGGATWEARRPPTGDALRDVFFSDAETGWILCERGTYTPAGRDEPVAYLLKTSDGGGSWARVEVTRGADVDLKLAGVRFAGRDHGWVFGEMGALFATRDGGATWTRQRAPTRHVLLGGAFLDARTGWLSGGGLTLLKTADGGDNWEAAAVTPPAAHGGRASLRLNAVCFVGPKRGWAVGAGGLVLSTEDGGGTWRPQSSGAAEDLYDVKFLDEREGWAVGGGGAMLHTRDGGRTWAAARRVTTHALERLFFVGRRGWAVGFGGTVIALKG